VQHSRSGHDLGANTVAMQRCCTPHDILSSPGAQAEAHRLDAVPVGLDLDAAGLAEADVVAQALALDGQVVLGIVRHERLHDERVHRAAAPVHRDLRWRMTAWHDRTNICNNKACPMQGSGQVSTG